jgi:subtilisin family serine protease
MISMAAVLPTALVAVCLASPAAATPGPHREEWWFSGWALQQEVCALTRGRGVTVGVIDSGVNASLPDLAGTVLPGKDYVRPSDRGMVDHDRKEWGDLQGGTGHGTGMASLIVGQGRSTGWVGVAPEARILPVAYTHGGVGPEELAESIRYVVDHGAKVISMSIGADYDGDPPCPPVLEEAVVYAATRDVVLVAAAGNGGEGKNFSGYPAGCPGVVAVGAVDSNQKPWVESQRKDYVAVAAPGVQVGSIGKDGHLYHWGSGTSQATALTSGIVALIRSRFPDMPLARSSSASSTRPRTWAPRARTTGPATG